MLCAVPFLRIGQCFGLCPFQIREGRAFQTNHWKRFTFITIAHISIEFFLLLHSLVYVNYWLDTDIIILSYIDFFCPMLLRVQVFAVLTECYVHQRNQIKIINSINFMHFLLRNQLKIKTSQKILKRMFWKFSVYFLLSAIVLVVLLFLRHEHRDRYYTLLYAIPFIYKSLHFYLTLIYVLSLKFIIQMINDRLRKFRVDALFDLDEIQFHRDFDVMKRCYTIIWKITKYIDQWMFWSLTIAFTFNLISIVTGLFWIIVHYSDSGLIDDVALFSGTVWLIISMMETLQICDACNDLGLAVIEKI